MNLYLLTQDVETGYDTYDSVVVAAKTETDAKSIHPEGDDAWRYWSGCWPWSPESVSVKLIGKAVKGTPAGVILSSFNAG
jgi:hypothetical protein